VALAAAKGFKGADELCMALASHIANFGVKKLFPGHVARILPIIDEGISRMWARQKRNGVKLQTWLDINMKTISVILDEEDLKVVCAQKNTEWTAVIAQVARLAASSVLGRVVFEKGLLFLHGDGFFERAGREDGCLEKHEGQTKHSIALVVRRDCFGRALSSWWPHQLRPRRQVPVLEHRTWAPGRRCQIRGPVDGRGALQNSGSR
jgi:hypothetical protein